MAVFISPIGGVGWQFFDNNGDPLSGGKLYTYAAGTTTPEATYTTSAGNVAHANPIILDSAGRVPGGEIWLDFTKSYKFILKNTNDVLIETYDNVSNVTSSVISTSPAGGLWTTVQGFIDWCKARWDTLLTTAGANLVGFSNSETYSSNTVGDAIKDLIAEDTNINNEITSITDSLAADAFYREVPSLFVRGDGNTRTDIFPTNVRSYGPGGVDVTISPLQLAKSLSNVIARESGSDIWVSPAGAGTQAGDTRANAMSWATAWRTNTTARRLLMIDSAGTYPPLSLLSGTHAGAASSKWLHSIDGRVRFAAETSLGQPATQTWTLHSGSVYKTVLTSVDYDIPIVVQKTLVPNVFDGYPDSILKYSSVAGLTALGANGEGWYFDYATRTLYMTYYGNNLTVSGNRNFHIVYSSKTLDSTGDFSAEWLLGGCTVILDGNFEFDGVWVNSKEVNSVLPIFITEGRMTQICPTSYGLRVEGLTYTSGRRCYRSKYDGLNGYKSSISNTVGMTIEHDLIVSGAGDINTYGTGSPHNNQGFSVHGAHNAMIFGALLQNNDGQGWGDICDSTHNSASWGVGVISRNNYVDSGISNGIYMDGSAGGGTGGRSAWLDTCIGCSDTRNLVSVASAVKTYNCTLPTELAVSGGTITDYLPDNP